MSFQAMAWAVKQETDSPISKLVLLMICNYANEDGECYPSQGHLADLCQCSRVSVNKHIQELRKKGFIKIIKKSNGQFVYNRYYVNMINKGYVKNVNFQCKEDLHNTIKNTNIYKFDEFWSKVPRKIAKAKAEKIYRSLIDKKIVDSKTLIFKMEEYASSVVNTESKYIVHPTTWLSQQRWEDELKVERKTNKNFLAG